VRRAGPAGPEIARLLQEVISCKPCKPADEVALGCPARGWISAMTSPNWDVRAGWDICQQPRPPAALLRVEKTAALALAAGVFFLGQM